MSHLKPGALCIIVAGCPENIGLIVEVLEHLGPYPPRADAYLVKTVSGRPFPQLRADGGVAGQMLYDHSNKCITDRHKLRPLIDSEDEPEVHNAAEECDKQRSKNKASSAWPRYKSRAT